MNPITHCKRCGDLLEQEIISVENDTGRIVTRCPFGHCNELFWNQIVLDFDLEQNVPDHGYCPWGMLFLSKIDNQSVDINDQRFTEFRATVSSYLRTYLNPTAGARRLVVAMLRTLPNYYGFSLPIKSINEKWLRKVKADHTIKDLCDYDIGWKSGVFFFPPDEVADYMVFVYFEPGEIVSINGHPILMIPDKSLYVWLSIAGSSSLYRVPLESFRLDELQMSNQVLVSLHLLMALNQDLFDNADILKELQPVPIAIWDFDKPFDSKQILIERHHQNLAKKNQGTDDE